MTMAEQIEEAKDKAKLVLLEGGPGLTIERLMKFMEKMFGRPMTEKDREEARSYLPHLPEK